MGSRLSFDRRERRSAWSLSVPLCLGMTRSISSRQAIFSSRVTALRNLASASLYAGVRLAGIAWAPYEPHPSSCPNFSMSGALPRGKVAREHAERLERLARRA